MTPEDFFKLLGQSQFYTCKGKTRLNIIRGLYESYCRAYLAKNFFDFYQVVCHSKAFYSYRLAAKHKDEGTPMIIIAEFMS